MTLFIIFLFRECYIFLLKTRYSAAQQYKKAEFSVVSLYSEFMQFINTVSLYSEFIINIALLR